MMGRTVGSGRQVGSRAGTQHLCQIQVLFLGSLSQPEISGKDLSKPIGAAARYPGQGEKFPLAPGRAAAGLLLL